MNGSIAERAGATELAGKGWRARVLTRPPLIAPARQFTFPFLVPGEEEALARGALWLEAEVDGSGTWLAQCALGFTGSDVAHGLWSLPGGEGLLACAGGYAYAIQAAAPERTALLPPRPAVGILALPNRTVLVEHHGISVREASGEVWKTARLSWEGVTVLSADDETVRGTGWDMMDDAELPFTVDLCSRTTEGGGYVRSGS